MVGMVVVAFVGGERYLGFRRLVERKCPASMSMQVGKEDSFPQSSFQRACGLMAEKRKKKSGN
jgi:hypothetical protein